MLKIQAKVTIDVGLAAFGEQVYVYCGMVSECAAWVFICMLI